MLKLPIGRDFLVPLFLLPWHGIKIDLGVGITIYQCLLVILCVKYIFIFRLGINKIPSALVIFLIIIISAVSSLATLHSQHGSVVYEGGEFRNGALRALVAFVAFTISILPFMILSTIQEKISYITLLRTYTISVFVLCLLGLIQYTTFKMFDIDILPIGSLFLEQEHVRSAIINTASEANLRITSVAGEPKVLGMIALSGSILLIVFWKFLFTSILVRLFLVSTYLSTIYLTQSTSAMISFLISVVIIFSLFLYGKAFSRWALFATFFSMATVILFVYIHYVSTTQIEAWKGLTQLSTDHFDEPLRPNIWPYWRRRF